MLKVDFHTHTYRSKDSVTTIDELISAARSRGIDRLVVTDHNTLIGAREAFAAAPDLVIPGEEVQTTEGELLAAYVTVEIPRGLEPLKALKRLRDQGAFVSISHPFDPHRSGWKLNTLERLAPLVDAIEVFNSRVIRGSHNRLAQEFTVRHNLAGTAGSDGHHPSEIGRAYSLLPEFSDAETLRIAIRSAEVGGSISSPLVHLYSTRAKLIKAFSGNK
ncbi:MAG: PHP domain-containing protein [Anaerolineaceae bacterium]